MTHTKLLKSYNIALCEEALSVNTGLKFALFLKQSYEMAWKMSHIDCFYGTFILFYFLLWSLDINAL